MVGEPLLSESESIPQGQETEAFIKLVAELMSPPTTPSSAMQKADFRPVVDEFKP
jgi:hypothetical protein